MSHMPEKSPRGACSNRVAIVVLAAVLVACASVPPTAEPSTATPGTASSTHTPAGIERPRSRWLPAAWSDLPGFEADALLAAWPALIAGCARPAAGWSEVCARLLLEPPAGEAAARVFLRTHLQPYAVTAHDGRAQGLITGYYEPLLDGRRQRDARHGVPLFAAPPGLDGQPWFTRQQIDTLPAARAMLAGREIAWLADPLDALVLQIQGSGRLRLTEPDGRVQTVRLAYAGHNGHPYRSVGRWLIDQGEIAPDAASWPAIKAWARSRPGRVEEMLWANPRVVFFKEEPLPDASQGPRGAMGVPLTPERSIAVDPQSIPYGAWVWIDSTEPLSSTPLQRLVAAQDTGSAIVGAVRADHFWGWGEIAEAQAGRMKQPLRMWVLWPVGQAPR
jgi:membrane-bound lytic murein transglycosylase A